MPHPLYRSGSPEHAEWVSERLRAYLDAGGHPSRDAYCAAEMALRSTGEWVTRADLAKCGGWGVVHATLTSRDLASTGAVRLVNASGSEKPADPARDVPVRDVSAVDVSDLDFDDDETRPEHTRRFVVTYAQNATPIHDDFFASLVAYAEHTGAELVVVPGRYKNPTSVWGREHAEDDWWDARLAPYLYRGRRSLAPDLTMFGDVSIQPTAVRPLTGWEVFAGQGSAIFGHPKIQLRCIPSAERGEARVLVSTGAVTLPNYTDSKAGKRGEGHHVQGAAVVEVLGGQWHLRQINADADGCFTDLTERFCPWGVEPAERPLALVMGDVHVAQVDGSVVDATLRAPDSIAAVLRPERIVYHDVLDFRARNHHDRGNPDRAYERHLGRVVDSVESEVRECVAFIDATPDYAEPVVIGSNHDEAFDRWLREAAPNGDPANARYFHSLRALSLARYEERGEWVPALELAYESLGAGRATFVRRDDPYVVGGVALHFHGDLGANGARGSVLQYAKLGVKTISGHGHTAEILDGAHRVGITGQLDQGYNFGPSSWVHAHCLLYADGKRSLIFIKNGRWRAPVSNEQREAA